MRLGAASQHGVIVQICQVCSSRAVQAGIRPIVQPLVAAVVAVVLLVVFILILILPLLRQPLLAL